MKKTSLLLGTIITALTVGGSSMSSQAAGNCNPFPCPQNGNVYVFRSNTCTPADLQSLLQSYLEQKCPGLNVEWNVGTKNPADCPNNNRNQNENKNTGNDSVNKGNSNAGQDCVGNDCKNNGNTGAGKDCPDNNCKNNGNVSAGKDCTGNDCKDNGNTNAGNTNTGKDNGNSNAGNTNTSKDNGNANTGKDSSKELSYEEQVVALVNKERAKAGLPALKMDATLQSAALARAKETVQLFSHTRPNGTSCFTILTEYGISYRSAGENIAYGQRSPEEVVNAWMNSAGHRANIMSTNFTTIGIGYYQTPNGTKYWSQLFLSK